MSSWRGGRGSAPTHRAPGAPASDGRSGERATAGRDRRDRPTCRDAAESFLQKPNRLENRGSDAQRAGQLDKSGRLGVRPAQVPAQRAEGEVLTDAMASAEAVDDSALEVADGEPGTLLDLDVGLPQVEGD